MTADLVFEIAFKASLVLAVAFAVSRIVTAASASIRHLVWASSFVAILVLPIVIGVGPSWRLTWTSPSLFSSQLPKSFVFSTAIPHGDRAGSDVGGKQLSTDSRLTVLDPDA